MQPDDQAYDHLSDEELAARCRDGIDAAERALLQRYMPAIYGLPQRAFGAAEEELSGYLLYALEKLRHRNTLARFNPEAGVKFRTWFGVVLRNLYLDYLRHQQPDPESYSLSDLPDLTQPAASPAPEEPTVDFLDQLQMKCRVLFKLLLANSFFLNADEIRWISEKSGRSLLDVGERLQHLESDLLEQDIQLQKRHEQLATVHWWKQTYARQLAKLERQRKPGQADWNDKLEATWKRLEKRRAQHERLLEELSGSGGLSTTPYRVLADLLNQKEGTIGSHLTRCRTATAQLLNEPSSQGDAS